MPDETTGSAASQAVTGTAPAITLWVIVVIALGYGIVKTVETALTLF